VSIVGSRTDGAPNGIRTRAAALKGPQWVSGNDQLVSAYAYP
jgi:hypothetical protein